MEQRAQIRTAAQVEVQRRLEAEATETVVTAVDAMMEGTTVVEDAAVEVAEAEAEVEVAAVEAGTV